MALLLMDGEMLDNVKPANGVDFQLEELYKLLECDIVEVVNLRDGRIMIIDEEGKFKWSAFVNTSATRIAFSVLNEGDLIVGNALVCKVGEFK